MPLAAGAMAGPESCGLRCPGRSHLVDGRIRRRPYTRRRLVFKRRPALGLRDTTRPVGLPRRFRQHCLQRADLGSRRAQLGEKDALRRRLVLGRRTSLGADCKALAVVASGHVSRYRTRKQDVASGRRKLPRPAGQLQRCVVYVGRCELEAVGGRCGMGAAPVPRFVCLRRQNVDCRGRHRTVHQCERRLVLRRRSELAAIPPLCALGRASRVSLSGLSTENLAARRVQRFHRGQRRLQRRLDPRDTRIGK